MISSALAILVLASTQAPAVCAPRSSDWLARLADGAEKRAFVLDRTGCHQFSAQYARPVGGWRTEAQWVEAVTRMLGYAGATTGFPVISAERDPARTAAWLTMQLRGDPPRGDCTRVLPGGASVTEFALPEAGDLPHDIAIDATGRVIVTGMFSHRLYVLDPDRARFSDVTIPVPNANPRAVEVDRAGNWWVVLGQPKQLARYSPDLKTWHTFDVGVYAHSLAIDASGRVWFNGHFTRSPELIGFVEASSGRVTNVEVPPHSTLATRPGGPIPYELRAARDGRVWLSELLGNRVIGYDPSTRAFRVHELPQPASGPRRFDVDADGIVWIPAYSANALLRLDPVSGRFASRHRSPHTRRVGCLWCVAWHSRPDRAPADFFPCRRTLTGRDHHSGAGLDR